MDVRELETLAVWYVEHFDELSPRYQRLISPVQHNASQSDKRPLDDEMGSLVDFLKTMNFEVLSLQQIKMLEKMGISQFLGIDGAAFIESTIKTSNYDPATATNKLNAAFGELSSAKSQFDAYLQSLNGLNLRHGTTEVFDEFITIRVGFQSDAAINNLTDWKDSAKDWYEIIRGLALASNEAPEETRVIGATTGSIILILAGTAAVTELLARISKHVTGVAKEGLEVLHTKEDLRQKKLLTKLMEQELDKAIDTRKKTALDTIMEEIKPLLHSKDGEKITALTNSIKKLLTFNEKGGNVDFVAPDSDENEQDENEEAKPDKAKSALAAARDAIREYQEVREQLKLLSYQHPPSE